MSSPALVSDGHTPPSPLLAAAAPPLPEQQQSDAWQRLSRLWATHVKLPWKRADEPPPPPSGYVALIPLSDARLQPRDTRVTATFLLAFALLVATAVFLVVPRGVSVGNIEVQTDKISWNTSKSTYQLKLVAMVPVFNPNFLTARISGDLRVLFYRTEAGRVEINRTSLPPRASPKTLSLDIDASDVPADYILAILSQCSTFPEVLVFFLKGRLTAQYLFMTQHLPTLDTYFMINCRDGGVRRISDLSAIGGAGSSIIHGTDSAGSSGGAESGGRVGPAAVAEAALPGSDLPAGSKAAARLRGWRRGL